jgi:hypothetical protein
VLSFTLIHQHPPFACTFFQPNLPILWVSTPHFNYISAESVSTSAEATATATVTTSAATAIAEATTSVTTAETTTTTAEGAATTTAITEGATATTEGATATTEGATATSTVTTSTSATTGTSSCWDVKSDLATVHFLSAQFESVLGSLGVLELNVSETSVTAIVANSNSYADDRATLVEEVSDWVLRCLEAHVSDEKGWAFTGWCVSAVAAHSGLLSSEFDWDFAAHMGGAVFSLDCLLGTLDVLVLDESNTTGATVGAEKLALGHGSVLAENLFESLLINIVGEGFDENLVDWVGGLAVSTGVTARCLTLLGVWVVNNLLLLSVVSGSFTVWFNGSAHFVCFVL